MSIAFMRCVNALENCKNHTRAKIGNTIQCKIYIAQEGGGKLQRAPKQQEWWCNDKWCGAQYIKNMNYTSEKEATSKGHPSHKNGDEHDEWCDAPMANNWMGAPWTSGWHQIARASGQKIKDHVSKNIDIKRQGINNKTNEKKETISSNKNKW